MLSKLKNILKYKIAVKLGLIKNKTSVSELLLKHLDSKKPINLIDIGAHDGDFTQALLDFCGISKGLLCEPIPEKASQLRQHFNSSKYIIFEDAISNQTGIIDFEINDYQPTSSILSIRREIPELRNVNLGKMHTIKCKTRTLDDVIAETGISKIDLIKLDVQGAEHLVIQGASQTLKITSMVWTEISFKALYEGSSTFTEIYDLMYQAGFKLLEIEPGFRSPDGELLQSDVLFVKL